MAVNELHGFKSHKIYMYVEIIEHSLISDPIKWHNVYKVECSTWIFNSPRSGVWLIQVFIVQFLPNIRTLEIVATIKYNVET